MKLPVLVSVAIASLFSLSVPLCVASTDLNNEELPMPTPISISYQDLFHAFGPKQEGDSSIVVDCPVSLLNAISDAFGPNGLGIVEITNIPTEIVELRTTVLSMAYQLANLPKEELERLELPETHYSIGWSHGKEQFGKKKKNKKQSQTSNNDSSLQASDKDDEEEEVEILYDTSKGSFYVDPFRNKRNVFPPADLLDLETPLLQVTHWMSEITLWVAQLCDAFLLSVNTDSSEGEVSSSLSNDKGMIWESLQSRLNTKARLLYYFPKNTTATTQEGNNGDDDWCGWHKDHGSLTALLPGLLIDENRIKMEGNNNNNKASIDPTHTSTAMDPASKVGLYIHTRNGSTVPVRFPPTSIAIQLGETVEIMSGGKLRATPHAVTSAKAVVGSSSSSSSSEDLSASTPLTTTNNPSIGRASLAVFVQPEGHQPLPSCPTTADESLRQRHRTTFGEFEKATIAAFS